MARKRKRREEEEDDDLDTRDDDAPAVPSKPKPRNDAYTGMLAITFLSLVASAVLFYMDFDSLTSQAVLLPAVNIPALGAGR